MVGGKLFVSNTNWTFGFKSDFRLILHYTMAALFYCTYKFKVRNK